jgi:hypothetical protein
VVSQQVLHRLQALQPLLQVELHGDQAESSPRLALFAAVDLALSLSVIPVLLLVSSTLSIC